MSGVFISYRRGDGGYAGRLKDHLLLRFGDKLVWQDVDDIKLGTNFPEEVQKAIRVADAVLIVIGPYWSTTGVERLHNSRDMVRMEIRKALDSQAAVIPVLVGGASMPESKVLPSSVARLVELNAATISDMDWSRGVQLLVERLQEIVRAVHKSEPILQLHNRLAVMEVTFFRFLDKDCAKALDVARDALSLLDEQMPHYPQDAFLQLERGYFLKNEAMAQRQLGNLAEFESSLKKAEQTFSTIRDESKMYLAGAYNGIGSTHLLRANFQKALEWIDQALELEPSYAAARQDRETALMYLKGNLS